VTHHTPDGLNKSATWESQEPFSIGRERSIVHERERTGIQQMGRTTRAQVSIQENIPGDSLCRPRLANAHTTYREVPVQGALAAYVVCRWQNQGSPGVSVPVSHVVPDGCVDLIWANGRLHVAGPDRVFQAERIAPGEPISGIRFHPGHAAAWLGMPVSEIVDGRPQFVDLLGADASRIEEEVAAFEEVMSPDLALERVLAARAPASEVDPRWRVMPVLLHQAAARGEPVVPWLKSEFGMSERTLRRQVEEAFGYGPKTLDRILRFQRFLHLIRARNSLPLARLAMAAGYADQAHLTRECRRLAGLTPTQIAADLQRNPGTPVST
jgi:AraC-like DNA-binding protein